MNEARLNHGCWWGTFGGIPLTVDVQLVNDMLPSKEKTSRKNSARLAWLDPHTESIEVPHEIHDWILLDK
jgi:hypothetical protein